MISTQKITTSEVRKYNKNRIFKLIYNSNSISRQEIADTLGLSLPTINQNIKLLKEEGLILLEGNFDSTGGRKAQMITVNASARYAVSVNICPTEIRTSLIDLSGEIKDEISLKTEFSTDANYGIKVAELAYNVIRANHISEDNLLGVGITMPGVFNSDNSMLIFSPPLKVKNYKTDNITRYIKYNYIVQNDARAGAFADYWYAHKNENALKEEDLEEKLYLMVSDGVGGAGVSNNTIKKGEHNRYGWGMVVDPSVCKLFGTTPAGLEKIKNTLLDINNKAIEGKPEDLVINTHVCRGNFHSTYASSGAYTSVASTLFAKENVNAYYLEYDDERSGGFEPLKNVTGDKKVVLGLITTKSPELEDEQTVIDRINEAAKYIPLDRLCLSPQCGFASCELYAAFAAFFPYL